jgi:hypothetical protein
MGRRQHSITTKRFLLNNRCKVVVISVFRTENNFTFVTSMEPDHCQLGLYIKNSIIVEDLC